MLLRSGGIQKNGVLLCVEFIARCDIATLALATCLRRVRPPTGLAAASRKEGLIKVRESIGCMLKAEMGLLRDSVTVRIVEQLFTIRWEMQRLKVKWKTLKQWI
jgi:hypothetical protein